MSLLVRVATLAIVAVLTVSPAVASAKPRSDPETDKSLGPSDGAGHYLGGQSSTSLFHGCRLYDEQWYPTSLVSGQPTTAPSTHKHVTFKVDTAAFPTFSWTAKAGYRICGVEVYATLDSPEIRADQLLTWASYTSGRRRGSTDTKGKETVKVRMPKHLSSEDQDLSMFEGKTLSMYAFQAITVYVKKG